MVFKHHIIRVIFVKDFFITNHGTLTNTNTKAYPNKKNEIVNTQYKRGPYQALVDHDQGNLLVGR